MERLVRVLAIMVLAGISLVRVSSPAQAATVLYDSFNGSASTGSVSGVTFSATTAVFDSQDDGIEYASSLFPGQGTMEIRLRIDQVGGGRNGTETTTSSVILDSAGADARNDGDIFLLIDSNGLLRFTLAPTCCVKPGEQVQVTSTRSILDGQYHTIAISYGSGGIKLFIDGALEDTDPFTGSRNTSRPVAIADFKERRFNPADYTFGFIGEVDAIRTSSTQSDLVLDTLPTSTPIFEDTFDGDLLDVAKWNTTQATSGKRWCSSTVSNHHSNTGQWLAVATDPCHTYSQSEPFGSITVGSGQASFAADFGRAFPYIWRGAPSLSSPFPSAGDFILEVRMKYDSLHSFGTGFQALEWSITDPTGDNPPMAKGSIFGVHADSGGNLRTILLGQGVSVSNATAFHDYRLEYVDGTYSLYVDNVLQAGPVVSDRRPSAMWIGNSVFTHWGASDWTDFTLDFVRVRTADSTTPGLSPISGTDPGFPATQYPYAAAAITVDPYPPTINEPVTLGVQLQNPTGTDVTVTSVEFAISGYGLGLKWHPVGSVSNVVIPANGTAHPTISWTPPFSGHHCVQVTLHFADGRTQVLQRNIDIQGFSTGNPHECIFTVGNPTDATATIDLVIVPISQSPSGWTATLSQTSVPLAAGATTDVTLRITPPPDAPPGSSATFHVEGYIGTTLIGGIVCSVTTHQAPIVNAGADVVIDEGATFIGSGSFSDADTVSSSWTATVDYGDGSGIQTLALNADQTFSLSHLYVDNGTYTVTVTVTDDQGASGADTVVVTVTNVAPSATFTAPSPTTIFNEGDAFSLSLSDPSDPSSVDTTAGFSYAFDCGQGYGTPSDTNTATCTALDDPSQTVKGKVIDKDGGYSEDTASVSVDNVVPTVGTITASTLDPIAKDTSISLSAPFTDPGILDTHTATWDWGDGTTSTGTVSEADGAGSVSGSHAYAAAGIYTVTLTVTDDLGSGQSMYQYIVVYDPDGGSGYVAGHGLIDSPPGAYPADPLLTGQARFGFVSEYKKGATVPTGTTRFVFHVADLWFYADVYEWLVVSGTRAQYKGSGTINDQGDYGFMLTAIDGDLTGGGDTDKFRIKIWEKVTDTIVYDNQMGASDGAELDPSTTTIQAGQIRIKQ